MVATATKLSTNENKTLMLDIDFILHLKAKLILNKVSYKMSYIFIICAGRSGSTALQNMLNSDPNVLIRGENNNFFFILLKPMNR